MNIQNFDMNAGVSGTGLAPAFPAATHYNVLNVDPSATRVMIREAYLRLKNLYSNGGDGLYGMAGGGDLTRQIEEIDQAFSVLNDDNQRSAYDRKLLNTGATPEATEWTAEADMWKPLPGNSGNEIIQTSRSTLKITKTQASGSNDQGLQEKFISAMEEGDVADGSILVALRELAGVNQVEMQERTKILLEYIRGMENNRFDTLPQVVYVKGFMRSYLRYLNVPNLERIVSAYAARLEAWQAGQK
jgi:curved DNA-binding protein CbpA